MDSTVNHNCISSASIESNETVNDRPEDSLELSENDIPGARLSEPLESHNVQALRWWLLCHGIKAPSSWKKSNLISR